MLKAYALFILGDIVGWTGVAASYLSVLLTELQYSCQRGTCALYSASLIVQQKKGCKGPWIDG